MSAQRSTDPEVLLSELQDFARRRGSEAQALAERAGLPVSEEDPTAPVTARGLARGIEADLTLLAGVDPAAPRVESALSGIDTMISAPQHGGRRATFTIEPLDKGFGHTYGSTLRRILLSSLAGAAVTAVHLDVPRKGQPARRLAREDFTEFELNLRDLVIRMPTSADRVEVALNARGDRDLIAADLELPRGIEVLNPEATIAARAYGHLCGSLVLARGRGYASAEQNAVGLTNGFVPIDSNFSPIRGASYEVATTRVGQRTDYDSLSIEVETDGSIAPSLALREASRIFIGHLSIFTEPERVRELLVLEPSGTEPASHLVDPSVRRTPEAGPLDRILIEELELGVRAYNGLKRAGVDTVGELLRRSRAELDAIPMFGRQSLEDVRRALHARGFDRRTS